MYYGQITNLPLEYLQEVYFGKSNFLLEAENQIGIIREQYKNTKDMTAHPATQSFNRIIEKQFGMELFALQIDQNDSSLNAYTIPIAKRFDIVKENNFKNLVEMNQKTGYRFKPNNGLCIVAFITPKILLDEKFTNAEILAILLHEIGHNFADAIHDKIRLYNLELMRNYMDYSILLLLLDPVGIIKFNIQNNNEYVYNKNKDRRPNNLKAIIDYGKFKVKDIISKISEFLYRLTGGISLRIEKLAYIGYQDNSPQYDKQNEIIADKFATINGYGPELQMALAKFGTNNPVKDFVEKIPVIGSMLNLSIEKSTADLFKFDEHPQNIQRIKSSISVLEFELNKSKLDPKVRKVIKEQIDQLNKVIEMTTKAEKDDTKADQYIANYNKFILDNDPYAINEDIEEKINEMLDNFGSK